MSPEKHNQNGESAIIGTTCTKKESDLFSRPLFDLLLYFVLPAFIFTLHFKDAFVNELFEVVAGS